MDREAKRRLIRLLRRAYSGELAAALAYRGHARAVPDPADRTELRKIADDELRHRECVGRMLGEWGESTSRWDDVLKRALGSVVGLLCGVSGWFAPMYIAGFLESRNTREYEVGASLARAAGRGDFARELLEMAAVESDHERYFRSRAASHPWWKLIPHW